MQGLVARGLTRGDMECAEVNYVKVSAAKI